ncbi:MAG: lysophospholipid acyltransferase family protein [Planctomycetota bacterium]
MRGPRVQRPGENGLILAPNHQSWVDPAVVQYAVLPQRITFLMTELFFDLPVLNWWFRAAGARRVREEGRPSVAGLRAAKDALADGEAICIFPEGEITTTGELGRGQRGVARLARRTGAPVIPIGIAGAINVWSKRQATPTLASIRIRLGSPMVYDETPDREGEDRFMQRLMETIGSLAE